MQYRCAIVQLSEIELDFGFSVLLELICLIAAHSDYERSVLPMKKCKLVKVQG